MNSARPHEKPALELCEEATFLLRNAPASAWTIYLTGSGPFLLALLYFWTDMTRGTFQETRLIGGSLILALLFIWMKTCHAMFASRLWAILSATPRQTEDIGQWLRVALAQTRLQPWGIFILPCATILMVPFPWVFAYFQNLTALGALRKDSNQSLHSIALEQARLWPKQNHFALFAITALGFIIFVDIAIILLLIPQLLITFLGVKEVFHPSVWIALNTTFLALVTSLTYLVVDPLIKALYILRCFYGQSLATGEDLRARLTVARAQRRQHQSLASALKIAALCLLTTGLHSAEPAPLPTPAQLDHSISETLKSSEYNWRFPRELFDAESHGILHNFFTSIGHGITRLFEWLARIAEWIGKWLQERVGKNRIGSDSFWSWANARELLIIFVTILVVVLIVMYLNRRRQRAAPIVSAKPVSAIPDLADENVAADQLPDDEWLRMAAQLGGQGELRLAIRALFLSALASMAGRSWISLALFKSNRDYESEFRRRAAAVPGALTAFSSLIIIYNRIWYGLHEPTQELLDQCRESVRVLRL